MNKRASKGWMDWGAVTIALLALALNAGNCYQDLQREKSNDQRVTVQLRVEATRLVEDAWDVLGGKSADKPQVGTTLIRRGSIERETQLEVAQRMISKALLLDPENPKAYRYQGVIYAESNRNEEAIVAFNAAVRLDPGAAPAWSNLGTALRFRQQCVEALEAHEKAGTKVGSEESRVAVNECGPALDAYHKAIEVDERYVAAWSNLGNLQAALGVFKEAEKSHYKAIQLKPNDPVSHHNLAETLRKLNRIDEAIAENKIAIDLDPKYVSAHIALGEGFESTGELEKAIRAYDDARVLDPDNELANNGLRRLRP